jgi:hypothetical protein
MRIAIAILANFSRSIIAALAITVLNGSPASADMLPGTAFVSGNWRGGAFETNKRFTHCAIYTRYLSGITMFFAVSDNWTWRAMWHHEGWRLTPGQSVTITLWIDSFPPRQLTAQAANPQLARTELPATSELFNQFRRGYLLTVVAEGQQYQFKLDGTNAALTQLSNCVRIQRQIAGLDPPPAPPPPAPKASPPAAEVPPQRKVWPRATAEQRLEATKLVANIMARADVGEFRILPIAK